ncbi:hypothetical protein DPMN_186798 [Dreissena polymorpha]|uniref:Uncharacterized protein n=1 Tax=Dreissena polymorpha TaxID=45954 RepID=A0A9D4I6V3_DREPO|nr:hypothetical protein DPMN_186798 [Dreissena polymorpha]
MFQYNFSRTDYSQLEAELLRLPSELQGSAINNHCGTERLWSQQSLESKMAPSVILPHILAYEVNKPKISAVRTLGQNRKRYLMGRTESFNISDGNCVTFIRDLTKPTYMQHYPHEVPSFH